MPTTRSALDDLAETIARRLSPGDDHCAYIHEHAQLLDGDTRQALAEKVRALLAQRVRYVLTFPNGWDPENPYAALTRVTHDRETVTFDDYRDGTARDICDLQGFETVEELQPMLDALNRGAEAR